MPSNRVKTAEEIAAITKASDIVDDTYDYVLKSVKSGMTEKELAALIFDKFVELGGSGTSFDTIVAFGENGCEPHHVPTDKKLDYGMMVTVDMGTVVDGYCSDFTRTFAFGEVGEEAKNIYDIVYQAQKKSLAAVDEGVGCRYVDSVARDYISQNGYGEYYIHGTGHGVGQIIHEDPRLNTTATETLMANEVITIEPGIYIPEKMGVRIEDMTVVGINSKMSRQPTELIIVK